MVMRVSVVSIAALLLGTTLGGLAQAQTWPAPTAGRLTTGSVPSATTASVPANCANQPNALGTSRVVEIDTTGGPGFGFEHFKMHDFLRPNEVVLTFDDGPWPANTPAVLRALAAHCVKATFFSVGKHAMWHPEILKQVMEQGHTVGTHSWSHPNLSKKSPQDGKDEIEKGLSAVRLALGTAPAPFFRFPQLAHPPELVSYLGERNIGIFSTDLDSFDFKMHKAGPMVQGLMDRLKKHGKGIILMHDFQRVTAEALPDLLAQLKANNYKIVHLKAKGVAQSLPEYDAMVQKEMKLPTVSGRPTDSVVRTVSE
jgi:peptidoglycan/xylan/chitin deacetylase (PgdA/CDA1 family)